ncbi:MMPL family transporter [Frankia sp. B2]|uniref:MMPL family transporter n=1 Tax=unclassified Frankia TaxID=2632575 RepID=UPI0004614C9C|nr:MULTISPECIES: MMPL family transporter [unclassified Frankia]KDA42216.1 putative RND superfamily drug exporter [Frankia sp. BMG5.23]TFE28259.1 MMPL family transporter [Frankia sp. B2]
MFTPLVALVTRRPRLVLVLTLLVLLGAGGLAGGAFGKLQTGGFDDPASDSSRAEDVLDARFHGRPNLLLLVTARAGDVDDAAVVAAGKEVAADLAAQAGARDVVSYWTGGGPALRSRDGRQALVVASVQDDDQAADIVDHYGSWADAPGAVTVRPGGAATVGEDISGHVSADLAAAESFAIPITLALLVIAFAGVVAALLPLGIGLLGMLGGFAALSVIGELTDVSIFAVNLATALGLGLGIDYSLLMVSRFREELAAGRDRATAVEGTVRSAGRTILFSGATVIVALAVMLVFPPFFLKSMSYAGISVTLVAMLAAVVALPALLMVLGERVNAWGIGGLLGLVRRRRAGRARGGEAIGPAGAAGSAPVGSAPVVVREAADSPFWRQVAGTVMRHPVLTGLPVIAVLLVLGAPFLHVNFGTPDDRVLKPGSADSRIVGDALRGAFAADIGGALDVVVQATGPGMIDRSALASYATALSELPDVARVDSALGSHIDGRRVVPPGPASRRFAIAGADSLQVVPAVDYASDHAQALVRAARAVPAPVGTSVLIGGASAVLVDGKTTIADRLPVALGLIALATFVLLFLFTGSVLLPVKAIVLNGLAMCAVFGASVWIFSDGHLSGFLDFTPGPLDTSMPVLLFCIAFGLSMDYEVFLLSRIKEAHDAGAPNTEAVATGLARVGRIVSTAAALLAVTFVAFGTSSVRFIQMFGIATALAIVLDATLIRGVLVPAFMRVAGDYNWWAPGPLRTLYRRFGLREYSVPEQGGVRTVQSRAGAPSR